MTEPDAPPPVPAAEIAGIVDRLERILLRGDRRYTRLQVADQSGIDLSAAEQLWRSLGFASVGDDDVVFTDGDVEALRDATDLAGELGEDGDVLASMTRLLGQTFSRLAAWQGQLIQQVASARPDLLADPDQLDTFIERMITTTDSLQSYVWRRQLAAYLSRQMLQVEQAWAESDTGPAHPSVVGFADMAGFTSLTRRASEPELRALLERFESLTTDVVARHGGRIVKTIGDEVLFVAGTPATGAELALDLLAAAGTVEDLPALRVGIAAGPVLDRLGDVYGSTVNIASRLTSLSRPGWILVDRLMAESLRGDDRFELRSRRPESVRGYHHLRQWRLQRADPDARRRSGHRSERRRSSRRRGEVDLDGAAD